MQTNLGCGPHCFLAIVSIQCTDISQYTNIADKIRIHVNLFNGMHFDKQKNCSFSIDRWWILAKKKTLSQN